MSNQHIYIVASYYNNHETPYLIKAFTDRTKADSYLSACKKHHKNKRYAPKVLEGPEFEEYMDFLEHWTATHPAGLEHTNKDNFRMLEVPLESSCIHSAKH